MKYYEQITALRNTIIQDIKNTMKAHHVTELNIPYDSQDGYFPISIYHYNFSDYLFEYEVRRVCIDANGTLTIEAESKYDTQRVRFKQWDCDVMQLDMLDDLHQAVIELLTD